MNHSPQSVYFLGVDVGGSQTRALIVSDQNILVGEGESEGGNPHNTPMLVVFEHIHAAIDQALAQAPQAKENLARACLGLAGFDTPHDKQTLEQFLLKEPLYNQTLGALRLYVVNDALLGLPLITDQNQGVVVVAGTGAHVLGRRGQETASAGCWGYVLGDQGSGFAFGHKLLQQVVAEFDGRRQVTPLTQAVLDVLELASVPDLLPFVYQKNLPIQAIASLTRLVTDARLHPYMQPYLDELLTALMEAFAAVVTRLGFTPETPLPVALVGGVLRQNIVATEFTRALKQAFPYVLPQVPQRSNVWGAIKLAQEVHYAADLPTQSLIMERAGL